MRTTIFILFLLSFNFSMRQSGLPQLKPVIGYTPDLSEEAQANLKYRDLLLSKDELSSSERAELEKLLEKHSEVQASVWDVIDGECSWYCGGGPYKITASSQLGSNYKASNIHDFSFKCAWVEGIKGGGIGEYIEYVFKNESPRINEIDIFNGYLKNDSSWKNNSRVKKLKLIINGKPYAILNLRDSKSLQTFKMPLLGRRKDKEDLILRFEIVEVYPGDKYEDTALTEIFFDGIDVH